MSTSDTTSSAGTSPLVRAATLPSPSRNTRTGSRRARRPARPCSPCRRGGPRRPSPHGPATRPAGSSVRSAFDPVSTATTRTPSRSPPDMSSTSNGSSRWQCGHQCARNTTIVGAPRGPDGDRGAVGRLTDQHRGRRASGSVVTRGGERGERLPVHGDRAERGGVHHIAGAGGVLVGGTRKGKDDPHDQCR